MQHFDIKKMKRRDFLKLMGQITSVPLMSAMSELAYGAGPYNDYKALVCVFLFGGNDSHNMIVPLDAARFADYTKNRGPLAIPLANFAANTVTDAAQGSFGFHPRMTQVSALFRSQKLAVVSNVGVILQPTSLANYKNKVNLPPQLFSHSDMQEHWHTANPKAPVTTGWGGRLADMIQTANTGQLSVSISTASSSIFLKGSSAVAIPNVAHQIGSYRTDPKSTIVQRITAWRDWDTNATTGANSQAVYQNSITMLRSNKLEDQFGDVATRSVELNNLILNTLYTGKDASGNYIQSHPINTVFPAGNPLASQLRSVAMMIANRQALGVKRQIFFVSVGGSFDTHSDQLDTSTSTLKPGAGETPTIYGKHADLLGQLDGALKAFYDATVELGVQNNVTTFTESDFSRTLTSNGKGSDHGWGSHHMVMGGAVKGGKIYGQFHNMKINTSALPSNNPFDSGQGRLIPVTSADQYAATLSKWMSNASVGELNTIFPNLVNFGSATDVGFL
ncbi:MAG: DUF1501 domain-containing protein [Pseudomonadota bacterium]